MEFCPECGSMLLPTEDNELKCSCGYTKKLSEDKSEYNVNEKIKETDNVIEKGENSQVKPNEYGTDDWSKYINRGIIEDVDGGCNKPVVLMKQKHVSLSVLNADTPGENTIKRIVYEKI